MSCSHETMFGLLFQRTWSHIHQQVLDPLLLVQPEKKKESPNTLSIWLVLVNQAVENQCEFKLACNVPYPLALVHIGLVAYQDLVDIIRSVLFNVTNPVPNVCNKVKKTGPEQSRNVKIKDVSCRHKKVYCWRMTRQWHHTPAKCPLPLGNKLQKHKRGRQQKRPIRFHQHQP